MKIQIGGLSEGIHNYAFVIPCADLAMDEHFIGNIHIDCELDKSATQILLTSSIKATANFECDRCVSKFSSSLSPKYKMVYVTEGMETARLDPAEVQVISPGLNIIDISDDVRQTLLLSIPLKLLCKESCKGLCPSCGRNLNEGQCNCSEQTTDNRWEGLRKLQSN